MPKIYLYLRKALILIRDFRIILEKSILSKIKTNSEAAKIDRIIIADVIENNFKINI